MTKVQNGCVAFDKDNTIKTVSYLISIGEQIYCVKETLRMARQEIKKLLKLQENERVYEEITLQKKIVLVETIPKQQERQNKDYVPPKITLFF